MKISIVTPSYNQASFLEATIRSVIEQGYAGLEYIVIDAGSTDGSVDIIKRYADGLSYWVSEADKGHADGINKGFAHSTGEIMGWINSSDIYYPWTLQTVAAVFSEVPEAQWITGAATHLDTEIAPQNIVKAKWNLYDFLSGNYRWIQQESVFWRRSLWDESGGGLKTDLKLACDFELWLRFMKIAPLYHVGTILGGFRYHDCRRGGTCAKRYDSEAVASFRSFKNSFGAWDRYRALLIELTNGRIGCVMRAAFAKLGCMPWYKHPEIVRDFSQHRWLVLHD